jgi:hypothetical protein
MVKLTKKRITNKRNRNISSIRRKRMASRRKRQVGGTPIQLPKTITFCVFQYDNKNPITQNICPTKTTNCLDADIKFTAIANEDTSIIDGTDNLFDVFKNKYTFTFNENLFNQLKDKFTSLVKENKFNINDIREIITKYYETKVGCPNMVENCGMIHYIGQYNEETPEKKMKTIGWMDIYDRAGRPIPICYTVGVYPQRKIILKQIEQYNEIIQKNEKLDNRQIIDANINTCLLDGTNIKWTDAMRGENENC